MHILKPLLRSTALATLLVVLVPAARGAGTDLPVVAPAAAGFSAERLARIDAWLAAEITAKRKAGAVALIARHGKIVYFKAFGSADLASGRPMRTDDYFRLWSMTKPVTAVALLTLYEQGRFRLTDPLADYLPAFKDARVLAGVDDQGAPVYVKPARPITIQDVFRHTAGFVYGYFGDTPVDRAYREAGIDYAKLDSPRVMAEKMAAMPLLYQPGTRWVYSFAADVQAALVEQLSGERLDAYCQRVIFAPLGMRDTFFGVPAARRARFATSYSPGKDGTLVVTQAGPAALDLDRLYEHFTEHPFGGAGLASTPADYLRFAEMLLEGGALGGHRILGRKTVELMTSDHLPPGVDDVAPGLRFGLGVDFLANPALAGNAGSVGQYGWGGLATTDYVADPKEDLVALLFTQYVPTDSRFEETWRALAYQALVR
jgi:CubicO group peptidase (beta-lactamase class C family)